MQWLLPGVAPATSGGGEKAEREGEEEEEEVVIVLNGESISQATKAVLAT